MCIQRKTKSLEKEKKGKKKVASSVAMTTDEYTAQILPAMHGNQRMQNKIGHF